MIFDSTYRNFPLTKSTVGLFGPVYRKAWELWQNLYPQLKQELVLEGPQ